MVNMPAEGAVMLSSVDTTQFFDSGSPPPFPFPTPVLTARQLRLGLIGAGITLASVEAAIGAISDDTERAVATVEWQYASQYRRDHPLIAQIGSVLGLQPEMIDNLWMEAAQL